MKRLIWLLTVLTAALALVAAGCGGGDESGGEEGGGLETEAETGEAEGGGEGEPIKIGLLATLEGPFTVLGEDSYRGAKLALLEYGGELEGTGARDQVTGVEVAGRPIELAYESSDATPDVAVEAMRRLVEQENVDIAVGPLSGDEGLAIKDYAKTQPEKTFLNGTSAAVETTLIDPAPNFFRWTTDGTQWMAGLGNYAYDELGYRRVATIGEDYSYPYSQVGGFMYEFCKKGGEVPRKIWVPLGTKDFASFIQQIPDDVDAIYVILGGADAINFVKQYDEFTGGRVPIIGGSSTLDQSVLEELGERIVGTPSAGPTAADIDTEDWRAFSDAYRENFPDGFPVPSLFAWGYYVNMKAALQALEEVEGDLSGGQEQYREVLAGLTLDGPTGPITLDENRQAIGNNYLLEVQKRDDGALVNTVVQTVEQVNQTLGEDPETYTELAPFEREFTCPSR